MTFTEMTWTPQGQRFLIFALLVSPNPKIPPFHYSTSCEGNDVTENCYLEMCVVP